MEKYMKVRNYEKRKFLLTTIVLLVIIEVITSIFIMTTKKFTYKVITGVVVKKNLISILTTSSERKIFYRNNYFYLNDKVIPYIIEEDKGKILKKSNKNYYELIISAKISNSLKANDSINISIEDKKISMIKLLHKLK